jgi:hypothetical protein
MRTRPTLLALTAAGGLALTAMVTGGSAQAAGGFGVSGLSAAQPKAPGLTTPNVLSPELIQTIRAQGSARVENPQSGIGYYGYDSVDNTPPLIPVGTTPEAHKTEPDKNTYLVLKGQTGPDAAYDYGKRFLFQGHESGSPGYVTRVNLDADLAHRVTLLATQDQTGALPDFDGSTYNPFTGKLMLTAEAGCTSSAGVWQGNPSYATNAAHSSFTSLVSDFGRGGYEGVQTASDGSIWLVEDVGGKSFGTPAKAKVANSFVYRFVPVDKTDLTKGGKLQALQASSASGPITFNANDPFTQSLADLHTYGKSFTTSWVTVHDSATGAADFCAGDLAKAAGATPFKRPENGVFRPGTGFGEFYFTETGDTDSTSPGNGTYGGFGGVYRLAQNGPSASTGTLSLAYKGDLEHTGLDNLQFFSKDLLAVVEDCGDTLHAQRNALDSGFLLNVAQAQPVPLRFLAEGRDPSATLDSALGTTGNDGDNEITGIHVSDGDASVGGLLGAKTPKPFRSGWRVFYTAQHGDNATYEVLENPKVGAYESDED